MELEARHRRGRSLSDSLVLEESEGGELIISRIKGYPSANQGLKEGDEVVGATINFDDLSKDDVLKVLKLMEPFNNKVHVLTKTNLNKSLENLSIKGPEEMLKDSYNKLYNDKIRRHLRENSPGRPEGAVGGSLDLDLRSMGNASQMSMPRIKDDYSVPRLGVDFGVQKKAKAGASVTDTAVSSVDLEMPDHRRPDLSFGNGEFPTAAGVELSLPKRPNIESNFPDLNSKPDIHLPDLKGSQLDGTNPGVDIKAPAGNFSMPGVRIPNSGLSNPKGPGIGVNGNLEAPDLNLAAPRLKTGITKPDVEIGMPSFDPRLNSMDLSGSTGKLTMPDLKMPDLELSTPQAQGPNYGLNTPDLDLSVPGVKGGVTSLNQDLNAPNLNIGMPSGKLDLDGEASLGNLKKPKFKRFGTLPKKGKIPSLGVSGPKQPNVLIDGDFGGSEWELPSGSLNTDLSRPELDIDTPSLNLKGSKTQLEMPDVDIDNPAGKLEMPSLKMPDVRLSEPNMKGSDYKLQTPNMDLSVSKSTGNVDLPDLKVPKMSSRSPKLDLNAPDVNLDIPSGKINVPTLRKPDNGLGAPDMNIDAHSGKFKMPKFGLSGTLPKEPNFSMNTDLNATDWNLKTPKIKGGINAPHATLPNMDIKAPKWDIKSPDTNISSPKAKFKWFKFKKPKFGTPKIKGLDADFDGDLDSTGMKINTPDIDINGPKYGLETPDVNVGSPSGKLQMPKFKMPTFNLPDPKLERPDLDVNTDLKTQDMSLKSPNLKGGILAPDLDMPNMDLKAPKLDLTTSNLNIGSPKGKIKMPKFKKPNFDFSGPNLERPSLGLKSPSLDLSDPKLGGGINPPDLSMPEIDLKSPNVPNINMGSGKIRLPTLEAPNADLNTPNFNAPSGKLKMPKFNLSGTLPKEPNMSMNTDLRSPDWSSKSPKLRGGIETPDLELPKMDLKAPKLDVNTPNLNIGSPKGKFKLPKFKKPNISIPSLKRPDVDINGPDIDVNTPNVNLKGPEYSLDAPDINAGSPSGNFKMPHLKMPNFGLSGPKLDGPNLDLKSPGLDLSGPQLSGAVSPPDLHAPEIDLQSTKLDLNAPKINMPSGKIKMPKFNLPGTMPKGPNLDMKTDLKAPAINLEAPKLKGGIDGPDLDLPKMDLKAPKLDMATPDLKIGSPKGKFKLPKFKKPNFDMPSLKGPDVDIDGLGGPDIDANIPNVNLKGPKYGLDLPEANFGSPSVKLNKPNLKMPDLNLSQPKLEGPNLDLKTDLKGKFKLPKFEKPKLRVPSPKGPGFDIDGDIHGPDIDVNIPQGNLKGPKSELQIPDVGFGSPSGKFKKPNLRMPDIDHPALDIDLNAPHNHFKGPKAGLEIPDVGFSSPSGKFSKPDLKLEKPNFDIKSPHLDLTLPKKSELDFDTRLESPKAAIDIPDVDVKAPSGRMKIPQMPKFDPSGFKGDINGPDMNITPLKGKAGIHGPDIDIPSGNVHSQHFGAQDLQGRSNIELGDFRSHMDISSPNVNMKPPHLRRTDLGTPITDLRNPKLNFRNPDLDVDDPSMKYSSPSYHNRRSNTLEGNMKMPVLDIDADMRLPHNDRRSGKANVRSSFPLTESDLINSHVRASGIDLRAPDLNVDDFTGKEHVLRARGSDVDFTMPRIPRVSSGTHLKAPAPKFQPPAHYQQSYVVSHPDTRTDLRTQRNIRPHEIDIQTGRMMQRNTRQPQMVVPMPMRSDSYRKQSEGDGGYFVTVFPRQAETGRTLSRKYNTLANSDFIQSNMDLEVPDGNDIKGSTYWFTKFM